MGNATDYGTDPHAKTDNASSSPGPLVRVDVAGLDLAQGREAIYSRFSSFLDRLTAYLQGKRGRASDLARFLGVRRQNVSRWIVRRWTCEQIPAWAAMGTMAWYYKRVSAAEDEALRLAAKPKASLPLMTATPAIEKTVAQMKNGDVNSDSAGLAKSVLSSGPPANSPARTRSQPGRRSSQARKSSPANEVRPDKP